MKVRIYGTKEWEHYDTLSEVDAVENFAYNLEIPTAIIETETGKRFEVWGEMEYNITSITKTKKKKI